MADMRHLPIAFLFANFCFIPATAQNHSSGTILSSLDKSPFDRLNPDGLSILGLPARTPTGFMYGTPKLSPLSAYHSDSWAISGFIEGGGITTSGNTDSALFNEYSDWDRGFLINAFGLSAKNASTRAYVSLQGGGVGRGDQYYQLTAGQIGKYKLTGYFQTLRHTFAAKAKPLWNGVGSGTLALPTPLPPGASSVADVQNALAGISPTNLSLKREKGGITGEFIVSKQLKLSASVAHEWRNGTRPFSIGFPYPGFGQVLEAVEPIDYQATDFRLVVNYNSSLITALFSYQGSIFNNAVPALTVENPGLSIFTPNYTAERGRFALAPDNQYHLFAGDIVAPLSFWKGRFSISGRYSISTQDEELLPPTISTGLLPLPGELVDLSNWNTAGALSQQTANAKVSRLSISSRLLLNPARKWRLSLKLRIDEERNSTSYTAFNPQTGQYGYIAMDGGLGGVMPRLGGVYAPAFGNRLRYRNIPYSKDLKQLAVEVDHRFAKRTKLKLAIGYKEETRTPREVETTKDFTVKTSLSSRLKDIGTVRLSYEYMNRGGSDYVSNPYEAYYTVSLPEYRSPLPSGNIAPTLVEFRKFDLVAKNVHTVRANLNFILSDTIDFSTSGKLVWLDNHADFGVRQIKSNTFNAEITWQPAPQTSFYAFASRDYGSRDISNVNDAGSASSNGNIGGPIYPLSNIWSALTEEKGFSVGGGLKHEFSDWKFDINYVYTNNRSELAYDYASTAAFNSEFSAAEAGPGLPDQTFRTHALSAAASWLIQKNLQLRFLYWYDHEDLDDYHYTGLSQQLIGNDIYLGAVPEGYSVHIFGAFFAVRF